MDQPADQARQFGVVAIQQGWEVEQPARPDSPSPEPAPVTLHEVGCTAELRQINEHPDGRFDIVTVGRRRFRITSVDHESSPYLTAQIEFFDDSIGEPGLAEYLAPRVLASFRGYLGLGGAASPAS